ncbi:precorrin-4 C(11)-methyltransferase [Desulfopila sp. IMCC35008]|uniref:precorrin-4 C(11)-methyltransferase n=1 Tax=Desulfopila sp. IMCC35008 TaxID=2653858 RepID=UPI0013D4CF04|nr:precorrin-4 C(11)-methyltransferase [Desulfopila sp. IMCC35008]
MNENPIYFIGAGPGDVELITVKGRRLLDEADCIIYAGSLVNKELMDGCKAELYDSAGMDLDEIIEVITDRHAKGEKIVRLHTGDPSIYGAIREQMQRLDSFDIEYYVVPGVTSAAGAAASLKAELTLPEVSQTVIITRQEGRTPVPEPERLRTLASHQATMMIFLSVSMIDKVTDELIEGGYPESTPVVVVEKATWKDEKIVRGTVADIGDKVRKQDIRKTAMICVGKVFAVGQIQAESKLYDRTFSHGTRLARNS